MPMDRANHVLLDRTQQYWVPQGVVFVKMERFLPSMAPPLAPTALLLRYQGRLHARQDVRLASS